MTPERVAELLGGGTVHHDPEPGPASCPTCGTPTGRASTGHVMLCLSCTCAEIGEYADELVMRVSRKMTLRVFLALPRDHDGRPVLPSLSYRAWRKLTG